MPRPLGDAVGERLELPEYYAGFRADFSSAREFWKLERGQVYAEPGDPSWVAFSADGWEEALRLLEARREDLTHYHADNAAAGTVTRRIRIVEGRIARGISAPGLHGSVRNSLPLHGSCRPDHLAAGFTQAQCAKYCGRLSAASMSILVAFFQVLRFLYLFMTHRSR